jgi:hypothetical protein
MISPTSEQSLNNERTYGTKSTRRAFGPALTLLTLIVATVVRAEEIPPATHSTSSDERMKAVGPIPPFAFFGGNLPRGRQAVLVYVDSELVPPPLVIGYRLGALDTIQIGIETAVNLNVFQVLLHTKLAPFAYRNRIVDWTFEFDTGYKDNYYYYPPKDYQIDDLSWVYKFVETLIVRLGTSKKSALFFNSMVYIDRDLHQPRRQTDYYVSPISIGIEIAPSALMRVFLEARLLHSINGSDSGDKVIFEGEWWVDYKGGVGFVF